MPNSFYAPYAKFEPDTNNDKFAIAQMIKTAITRHIARHGPESMQSAIDADYIDPEVFEVQSDGSTISFFTTIYFMQMRFPIESDILRRHVDSTIPTAIVMHLKVGGNLDGATWSEANLRTPNIWHEVALDKEYYRNNENQIDRDLFMLRELLKPFERIGEIKKPGLLISLEEDELMNRYNAGVNGDPVQLSGSLVRMIYFSAVTITTVGFGDIVPMTSKARILVAIEAFFGIAMAALFLNAITSRK